MVGWGILGTGTIAGTFAEALEASDGGTAVAVASRRQGTADVFAERFGIPTGYEGDEALLADPRIDAVYIATPNNLHHRQTVAALAAGKAVLCEKPFALSGEQASEMAAAARRHGRFCMEAMWTRFLPFVGELQRIIGEGRIGDVQVVEADLSFPAPDDPNSRWFSPALGGGSLLDLGVYPITIAVSVLGFPDEVVSAATLAPTGVDDQVGMVFTYERGALAVLQASLRSDGPVEATVIGSEGYVRIARKMHHPMHMTLHRRDEPIEAIDTAYEGNGLGYEIDEVHRCLSEGLPESELMPLDESVRMMELLDRIRSQIGVVYPDAG